LPCRPATEERLSYGTLAVFVGDRVPVRISTREPGTVQFNLESFDERELLVESDPDTFFFTEHFRSAKAVLGRIAKLDAKTFRAMIERRWRGIAPK
jgi:hypothetical protein